MSGTQHVDCNHCGRRFTTTAEQARKERVLRCACGQYVRIDHAFPELRSEPIASRTVEVAVADEEDEEDEQTHMLSSLSAVAAMSSRPRARSTQPSLRDDELISRPVPRGTLRSLSPASFPNSSDKPVWHVELGGREPTQMSTEQLIIARRSGRLAEDVLVWREGMSSWRPVGTLISAVSISERAPAPESSRPASGPPPARSASEAPSAFESFERPAPTLEFALEKPAVTAPRREPSRITIPPPSRVPRAPMPLSRPSRPSMPSIPALRAVTNTPLPAARPESISVPPPPPPPPPSLEPLAIAEPVARASNRPTDPPQAHSAAAWLGERPLWITACLALTVCVVASSAGALVVRSLRQRQQPVALPVMSASLSAAKPAPAASAAPRVPASSEAPRVVDLESLSVERRAPRWKPRPVNASAPSVAPSSDDSASSTSEPPEAPANPDDSESSADQPGL